jgi:hypothetical protein
MEDIGSTMNSRKKAQGFDWFVTLLIVLAVSGLVLAQTGGRRGRDGRNASGQSLAAGAGNSSTWTRAGTFLGESRPLGNGAIRSWVTLDRNGHPSAIGATFSEAALSGLPAGAEGAEYALSLPPQAQGTAFDHISVDWNAQGHPPAGIYNVSHFDFHFYTITPQERDRITAQGEDVAKSNRQPSAEYMPSGYVMVPDSAIPRMGSHLANPQARELHGQPFTRTFLYGSYDGRVIFYEPMIARSFLESKQNVTEYIKLPARYPKPGYYPTKYSVRYDPKSREYTVSLEGLTLR